MSRTPLTQRPATYGTQDGSASPQTGMAAAPPSLVVDLESVAERVHVDPRVLARHLQPEHPAGEEAPKQATFDALSLEVFNDLVAGKSVILPGRESVPVRMDATPRYAHSTRIVPAKKEGWTPVQNPATRTPPVQHWRTRMWWADRREQHAKHVRGVIVQTREARDGSPAKAPEGTPVTSAAMRPLLSTPYSGSRTHTFGSHQPAGLINSSKIMPIKAVVVPIKAIDPKDPRSERMVAVPMSEHDESLSVTEGGLLASTRMRGRMPDEIEEVEVRIEEGEVQDKIYLIIHFARPLVGWMALFAGVMGQAMQGPVIKMINVNSGGAVNGFLLGAWNAQGLCMLFSLWAIFPAINGDFGEREKAYLFSAFGFSLVMASGIISGLGSGAWTESFQLTTVPQGYLFNSFHPTLIVFWRMLLCRSVLCAEKLGVVIGVVGAALSLLDRGPSDAGGAPSIPQGDALAFCSSLSLCFYLLASKKVRPHLPLSTNLAVVTFFSAFIQIIVGNFIVEGGFSFGTDPNHGIFGYFNPARVGPWLLLNAVGCVAQAGYIGALKYLNPIVVSICMTCEPVVATWITMLILGESLDEQGVGLYTVLGGFGIIVGSLVVSIFSTHHMEGVELDVQADTGALDDENVDAEKKSGALRSFELTPNDPEGGDVYGADDGDDYRGA